eukprot:CAMPEP_0183350056 /NCGR_PEP_ID=MMETSP0164_2-20130417/16029_1 /TAXON_ID=221442 /ORGANISM="Coccolithus pelagicus ssp braarudi, Strain PLY182g" /LENGTH=60 /DNA_ID=CAMNT_0025521903 /DNA_START=583 /DNA_END=762 /DNA_ORIENTATION=-
METRLRAGRTTTPRNAVAATLADVGTPTINAWTELMTIAIRRRREVERNIMAAYWLRRRW